MTPDWKALADEVEEMTTEASTRVIGLRDHYRALTIARQALEAVTSAEAKSAALALEVEGLRKALTMVRDRFFPADQDERDRDLMWDPVNEALASSSSKGDKDALG